MKRQKKSVYVSVVFLCLTLGTGVFTGYILISKAYNKLKNVRLENPFKGRTGNEIYTALFGSPAQNCVEVINKMDQLVPRLDCCIWLEFKTCPSEVKRIVALQSYEKAVLAGADSSSYIPTYSPRPEWFRPGALGDSIILLQHNNNPNRDQILLLAKDSTHAFYCDMAD